jgi:hypothetical protein
MYVKATFLKHFDAGIPIHDASIEFDFEGFNVSRLQGLYNVSRGLLAPIF